MTAMISRSARKARLLFLASRLPLPRKKTTAVCTSVYNEFMPSRHGVTMVLLIMDWNTSDAAPMAKATSSMTTTFVERSSMV